MAQPVSAVSWPARLLVVGAIVTAQVLAFGGCLFIFIPALHGAGVNGFWVLSTIGGAIIFVAAPAVALFGLRFRRPDTSALSSLIVPVIAVGDALVTALILQLPTDVPPIQAFASLAGSVAAFVAVPLLGTFLPMRMRTRNTAKRNNAAII